MMQKIDVIIIAKDEEDVIERAVLSVKDLAENIFVIDGGSKDGTISVARKNGARVVPHRFVDFEQQRNFALTVAVSPWVFYLDADEVVTAPLRREIRDRIESDSEGIGGFILKRKTFFFNKDWGYMDRMARVFRRESLKGWAGVVHESPEFSGDSRELVNPILHFTHRNLEQMVAKTNEWSNFEAQLRFDAHHPPMQPWRFFRVMVSGFFSSFFSQGGYKNGTKGLIEGIYQAYSLFITYAKLWELQVNSRKDIRK